MQNSRIVLCLYPCLLLIRTCFSLDNVTISVKSNFCSLHQQVENNEIPRALALKGQEISVALITEINYDNKYHAVRILDEIARRGEFTYKAFPIGIPSVGQTWTDLVNNSTIYYDISVNRWARNKERMDLGLMYPESYYNADSVLVMREIPNEDTFVFWSFSKPFSPSLWILISFTIIFTGALFYLLDFLYNHGDKKKMYGDLTRDIFTSFYSFAGSRSVFQPKSRANWILTISMCFLYLILVSAYTANLANFYVLKSQPKVIIEDIGDVIDNSLLLCAPKGYAMTEDLKKKYKRVKLLEIEAHKNSFNPEADVMQALSNNQCDLAIMSLEDYKMLKRDTEYNLNCDITWIGRKVFSIDAGFAVKDSEKLCSSLLYSVFDYHLIEMKKDGIIDDIMEAYREQAMAGTCITARSAAQNQEPALTPLNMGGAFAFHAILIVFSFAVGLFDYLREPKEVKMHVNEKLTSSFEKRLSFLSSSTRNFSSNNFRDSSSSNEIMNVVQNKRGIVSKEVNIPSANADISEVLNDVMKLFQESDQRNKVLLENVLSELHHIKVKVDHVD